MRLSTYQNGSLTILALFVIVILTLLGLSLADQLRTSSQNVIYEVQGTRAYMAAKSGLELLAAESFPVGANATTCNNSGTNVDVSSIQGLQNCSFTVRCTSRNIAQNGIDTLRFYQFESTGVCQAGLEWASKTLAQEAIVRL
jgi:MSHA biogenesis protein MshP